MNQKMKLITLLSAGLISLNTYAADILMVGLDKNGAPVDVLVPESEYRENLRKALTDVQTSTIPVLQNKSETSKGWLLRTAVVGIGVNMEIGIGEWKFGVLPRFRVGFSNAKDPAMP